MNFKGLLFPRFLLLCSSSRKPTKQQHSSNTNFSLCVHDKCIYVCGYVFQEYVEPSRGVRVSYSTILHPYQSVFFNVKNFIRLIYTLCAGQSNHDSLTLDKQRIWQELSPQCWLFRLSHSGPEVMKYSRRAAGLQPLLEAQGIWFHNKQSNDTGTGQRNFPLRVKSKIAPLIFFILATIIYSQYANFK